MPGPVSYIYGVREQHIGEDKYEINGEDEENSFVHLCI
jgi:hypothetical protein